MLTPLVTIIIPVYNSEKTLRKCLLRIQAQSYRELEVLMVDDGSTDSTQEICREFCNNDSRFRLLSQSHQGVAAARNLAMTKSNGKYIQFCDGDDWMTLDATESLVKAAVQTGSDLVTAGFYRVVGANIYEHATLGYSGILTKNEFVAHMMAAPGNFYYGVLWNKLYRRSLIYRHMLSCPEDLSWCEDTYFNYTYLKYTATVTVLTKPIYFYKKTRGSLSTTHITLPRTIHTRSQLYQHYRELTAPVTKNKLQLVPFWLLPALDGGLGRKRSLEECRK